MVVLGPALAMSLAWTFASSHPRYTQFGVRNAIMAATLVYLIALILLSARPARWSSFLSGMLITLAIFLREPFILVPIVSFYLAYSLRGRLAVVDHIIGIAVGGTLLLSWVWIARADPWTMLGYYRDISLLQYNRFQVMNIDRGAYLWGHFKDFLYSSQWFTLPAIVGLLASVPARKPRRRRFWIANGLGLLLALPPLYDIFKGGGVSYHWTQLFLSSAFLGAIGLKRTTDLARAKRVTWIVPRLYLSLIFIAAIMNGYENLRAYRNGLMASKMFAPVMVWGDWDNPCVSQDNALAVAAAIRENTDPDDPIITSGQHLYDYSLTGRFPVGPDLVDLFFLKVFGHTDRPDVRERLRQDPPEIIVAATYFDPDKHLGIHEIWPDFEDRYELVRDVNIPTYWYGGAPAARVYRLRH